jgi:hypothetical protein
MAKQPRSPQSGGSEESREPRTIKKLNEKHRKFLRLYLALEYNVKEAWKEAGYSDSTATSHPYIVLNSEPGKAYLRELSAQSVNMTEKEMIHMVVQRAFDLAMFSLGDIVNADKYGYTTLKAQLKDLPAHKVACISSIGQTESESGTRYMQIKALNPYPALRMLARYCSAELDLNALISRLNTMGFDVKDVGALTGAVEDEESIEDLGDDDFEDIDFDDL